MKRYITEKELCSHFEISRSTARKHFGYAIYRIGRCIRYDLWQIEARTGDKNECIKQSN